MRHFIPICAGLICAGLAMASGPAGAVTTLFYEDFSGFSSSQRGVTGTLGDMEVRGRVNLFVPPSGSPLFGKAYVELDGDPLAARGNAIGKSGFTLEPGKLYTMSFRALGNRFNSMSDLLFIDLFPSLVGATPGAVQCTAGGVFALFGTAACPLGPTLHPLLKTTVRPRALSVEGSLTIRAFETSGFGFWIGSDSGDGAGPLIDWVRFTVEDLPTGPPGGGPNPPPSDQPPGPPIRVVPEPATWAMLIAGFGLVGLAARRRKPRAA